MLKKIAWTAAFLALLSALAATVLVFMGHGLPGSSAPSALFAAAILLVSGAAMIAGRELHNELKDAPHDPKTGEHESIQWKVADVWALFARDFSSLTYDVASHADRAEVAEYRGIIHWHRDVLEKILSIGLTIVTSLWLGRACEYFVLFILRRPGISDRVEHDLHSITILIGLALVIDGILLVASMTDAPGIGRTLDSLIVFLAGGVILSLDPLELLRAHQPTIGIWLALSAGVLFLVRWTIRHRDVAGLLGRPSRRGCDE